MSKGTKTVVAKKDDKKVEKKAAAKTCAKACVKSAPKAAPKAEAKAAVKKEAAKVEKKAAPKAAPKKAAKVAVEFVADCPLASSVSVAGTFNNWAVDVDILKKDKKSGLWKAKINLVPGDYEYKFVCDGKNWDEGDNKIKHV
ncbi:MAG: glycoside hydrolase [Fibrobacter sp.]|nr:glycoside hydrolase [Fibrobacter sp.]